MKKITARSLKKLNIIAGCLHLAQAVAVLLLSKSLPVPVSGNYLEFDKATQSLQPTTTTLFNVDLPWLIAAFFFLSAFSTLLSPLCTTGAMLPTSNSA